VVAHAGHDQAEIVLAIGENDSGQVSVPAGITGAIAIAAGENHRLAIVRA
jgi:hypothetical protein